MTIDIITGPTASGKSSVAYELAERDSSIEIISADAFQVYKYFNIGTAKPSVHEQNICKHHLIDILEPSISYTAGRFFIEAERLIDEIISRGKKPLIVGGTGLYIQTLTDGLFLVPEIDKSIRENLKNEIDLNGLEALYERLLLVDNDYAVRISANDSVRIIRALEIYEALGMPLSEAHKRYHQEPKYKYRLNVIHRDRAELYDNINKRVEVMFRNGWVDEVVAIIDRAGYNADMPAFRAIGYRDIAGHLLNYGKDSFNSGTEDELIEIISRDTRRFAKRQLTWFRSKKDAQFSTSKEELIDLLSK